MRSPHLTLALLAFGLLVNQAQSAPVTFLEDVQGPFSTSSFGPTPVGPLGVGTNVIDGGLNDGTGPNDVLTFEIGEDTQLIGITLRSYTDGSGATIIGDRFFFGIHNDTQFPVDEFEMLFGNPIGNEFIGGLVIGDEQLGDNIITQVGNNIFGIGSGFTPPLGEGPYTIYMQQTSSQNSQYNLEFEVEAISVPEPSTTAGLACIGAIGLAVHLRRKRKR